MLDRQAPLVATRKDRRPCPWLTPELVHLVRERNWLHRLWMQDRGNEQRRAAHRTARAAARKLGRSLQNSYFIRQCAAANQRQLWAIMNNVTGRKTQRQTPEAPIETLSAFFGEIVHDPARPAALQAPHGPLQQTALTSFQPVSVQDVEQCLACVNPHKASGSDCIPGIVLQCCASVLAPHLARIINISLSSGTVPTCFKLLYVSPLFKSGDTAVAGNYRPVSLLPIVSRLLEHCVKKQIMANLQDHHLLPASQFAYRKSH